MNRRGFISTLVTAVAALAFLGSSTVKDSFYKAEMDPRVKYLPELDLYSIQWPVITREWKFVPLSEIAI